MKIKFAERILKVMRVNDTAEKRENTARQVNVTLEENVMTTDELYAVLEAEYTEEFVLEKEDGKEETFAGYPRYTVTRNIEKTSEQTMICFSK